MAHILIIDDNEAFRATIRFALQGAGHQVTEAANGKEGIRAYRQSGADVILCDLVMPEKEGLETILELRRDFPAAGIIAMSGGVFNGQFDCLPVAKHLGAREILYKPFSVTALLEAVNSIL